MRVRYGPLVGLFDVGSLLVVFPEDRTPAPDEVVWCDGRVWAPGVGLLEYHVCVPRPYLCIVRRERFASDNFGHMVPESKVYWCVRWSDDASRVVSRMCDGVGDVDFERLLADAGSGMMRIAVRSGGFRRMM